MLTLIALKSAIVQKKYTSVDEIDFESSDPVIDNLIARLGIHAVLNLDE